MTDRCLGHPVRGVAALQNADNATVAPGVGSGNERSRQSLEIVELERKTTEGIAGQRVETRRDENQLRNEPLCGCIDTTLQGFDVLGAWQTGRTWKVPYRTVRAVIIGRPRAWVPRPLVHGDEMDLWLFLDQRLGTVAVVNVPVHDEDPLQS